MVCLNEKGAALERGGVPVIVPENSCNAIV
jgi:hypothetical protein